ncbi:Ethylene-responsive transcription factor ERF020 [Camellia lanceoleosa]|uniref:Ethylene-responsive transcription factor ERF020 n=1 Tax=Camellia lanceoleosa TaxID=1840588 RepID=A0ACC0FNE4_9ERIC|nr:Ethylene-responsive transcription factor ERF020 [Camellia lanceoleosa]
MSSSDEGSSGGAITAEQKKYKGVRRRKWGKWVSEIRVPGTQDRLWLGSYSTAEAAAVAHDVASYCLRGPSSYNNLNFPAALPVGVRTDMSPQSVQKAASDAGMAVDAQFAMNQTQQQQTRSSTSSSSIDSRSRDESKNVMNENNVNDGCFGVWEERMMSSHELEQREEALNISVEDYL